VYPFRSSALDSTSWFRLSESWSRTELCRCRALPFPVKKLTPVTFFAFPARRLSRLPATDAGFSVAFETSVFSDRCYSRPLSPPLVQILGWVCYSPDEAVTGSRTPQFFENPLSPFLEPPPPYDPACIQRRCVLTRRRTAPLVETRAVSGCWVLFASVGFFAVKDLKSVTDLSDGYCVLTTAAPR